MSTWRAEEWGNSTSNLGLLSGCDPQKDREHLNLYPIQTASSKTSHKKLKQEIVLFVFVRPTWHSVNQAQSFRSVSTAPRAVSSPWTAQPVPRWTQPPHRFKDCCLLQPHYNSRFDAGFFSSQQITPKFPSSHPSTVGLPPTLQQFIARSAYVIKILQRSSNGRAIES